MPIIGEVPVQRTHILGIGHHVPEKIVTNHDLEAMMDTTDEWIRERTGIEQRHFIDGVCGPADLGYHAAVQALDDAGLRAEDVDLIIFATLSSDVDFPGSGVFLQRQLEIPGVPALDIRNQCSGFIYGLSVADAFIKSGQHKTVLLVGGEVHSTGLNFTTAGRDISVLFGDGAGAVVLGPVDDGRGILSTHLHADGRHAEDLWMEFPSSRVMPRISPEALAAGRHYPEMKGRRVFKFAVTHLPEVVREGLDANNLTVDDIDMFIPHQANLRINEAVAKQLGLPPEKVFNNIQKYGNTTAASIPIALHEALDAGVIQPGNLVVFGAFGSGYTWASAIIQF